MGRGKWLDVDSWPPDARPMTYYLDHAKGENGQLTNALSLELPSVTSTADTYVYDPAHPTPVIGGPLMSVQAGKHDQGRLESRSDVLFYTTPPLVYGVEVIGPVRLVLYVRSSLEFTDFVGRLCDVYPDGRSFNVCEGMLRIDPGKGEKQSDGSLRIEVDLWATAYDFQTGHAIRLQVCSGGHPRWNRNLGTNEPLAVATKMFSAHQTLYHDRDHPSALILPVTNF
jgi:putative CocE/NonD family hydrolase